MSRYRAGALSHGPHEPSGGDGFVGLVTPADKALARLRENYALFDQYVTRAEQHLAEGHFDEAALTASAAAWVVTKKHAGVFASERLERLIHAIAGTVAGTASATRPRASSAGEVRRVLNVATELVPVGGLTRMISRWINTDNTREHSVAVTRFRGPLPEHLTEAVSQSGGDIHILNNAPGTLRDWAARLRSIARDYDLIILHIHCEDVLPLLAFSNAEGLPPVLMCNHADHLFWLGPSVCHSVLSLREAAADIVVNRRGVAPERSLLLPTLVDAPSRHMSKADARAALGVPEDSVVMVSIARGAKYLPIGGQTYASRFVDILKANPKARLFVVGPGMPDGWDAASASVNGRITGIEEHADPWVYFEAADIYVDSYPFSSSTSLMEAAGYGLPLVSLFTGPDEARIVGINHLGLIGGFHQARSEAEWANELSRLAADPHYRAVRGAMAAQAATVAQPAEWKEWLERAYQASLQLPAIGKAFHSMTPGTDIPQYGEPDIRHQDMYGSPTHVDDHIKDYLGRVDYPTRIRVLKELRARGAVKGLLESARLHMPEWLKCRLRWPAA